MIARAFQVFMEWGNRRFAKANRGLYDMREL
jgi:hypothetical protein